MDYKKNAIYSFLGLPASGKGTQAELLVQKLGIESVIGVGELVRNIMSSADTDPKIAEIRSSYNKGIPQTDETAIFLMNKYLEHRNSDVILDGFPLSVSQAEFIKSYIEKHTDKWQPLKVVYIKIDPEAAIKRALSRKICSGCKKIFASTELEICDECGGELIVRSDDNEETMRKRISEYMPRINDLLAYYSQNNLAVIEINGNQTIDEVAAEVDERI